MSDQRYGVVVNSAGGSADDDRLAAVRAVFEDAGVEHRLYRADGDPTEDAEQAVRDGCTALVVGGGDGTVGSVAAVALAACLPLGVLPMGTLNHFSRDLGLPDDPAEAAAVALAGHTRHVDVGCAGDLVFVNNVSVGAYARMVAHRESLEGDVGKLRGGIAAVRAVFPYRPVPVEITVDGESISTDATIVFFGNNEYVVEEGRFTRERLDGGELSVYVLRAPHLWDVLRIAFRIARDRIGRERDLVHRTGKQVTLSIGRPSILLAHDGEVTEQPTPLEVTVTPGALRVFVPAAD